MIHSSDQSDSMPPFPAFPCTARYVPVGSLADSFARICRSIDTREAVSLVIGPPGTGKSLLCGLLAERYRESYDVVVLGDAPIEDRAAFQRHLLHHLGIDLNAVPNGDVQLALIDHLCRGETPSAGLLMIIDEAQSLSAEIIEAIRVATNIMHQGQPRVSAVLCGGMKLDEVLVDRSLEAFNQRIATRCYLHPMNGDETRRYLCDTISACGAQPEQTLANEAVAAIHHACGGVPRLVNQMMTLAIDCAAEQNQQQITEQIVNQAWSQLQQLPSPIVEEPQVAESTPVEFGELSDAVSFAEWGTDPDHDEPANDDSSQQAAPVEPGPATESSAAEPERVDHESSHSDHRSAHAGHEIEPVAPKPTLTEQELAVAAQPIDQAEPTPQAEPAAETVEAENKTQPEQRSVPEQPPVGTLQTEAYEADPTATAGVFVQPIEYESPEASETQTLDANAAAELKAQSDASTGEIEPAPQLETEPSVRAQFEAGRTHPEPPELAAGAEQKADQPPSPETDAYGSQQETDWSSQPEAATAAAENLAADDDARDAESAPTPAVTVPELPAGVHIESFEPTVQEPFDSLNVQAEPAELDVVQTEVGQAESGTTFEQASESITDSGFAPPSADIQAAVGEIELTAPTTIPKSPLAEHSIDPTPPVSPPPALLFGEFEQEEEVEIGSGFARAQRAPEPSPPASLEAMLHQEIVGVSPDPESEPLPDELIIETNENTIEPDEIIIENHEDVIEYIEETEPRLDPDPVIEDFIRVVEPNEAPRNENDEPAPIRIHDARIQDDRDILVIEDELGIQSDDPAARVDAKDQTISVDFQAMLNRMRSGS